MSDLEKEIELYFSGEMTPKQKLDFEEKIKTNSKLEEEINIYKEMHSIYDDTNWKIIDSSTKNQKVVKYEAFLKSEKGKNIAHSIKNIENEYFTNKPTSHIKKWLLYGTSIAAIFIIAFLTLYTYNSEIDGKSLYTDYKNWNSLPSLTLRSENTSLAEAEKLFRQQSYAEALNMFNTYQSENSKELNPQVLLYKGVTQLELNQNENAQKTFEQLLHSDTLDASKAHWYLALVYLKTDHIKNAQKELQIVISNPKNDNYIKALDLIKKLE